MKSPTSFYRIILPDVMRDHKLMIPKDFARVHRNELSTKATLTVPGGLIWDIRLEKSGKKLWFHDGWKEFAEKHSIGCWFFVLFKYEGNSKFNVHIFDLTATEISYPRNNRKPKSVSDEGDGEGDDSVEILSSLEGEPPSKQQVPYECINKKATGERYSNSFLQNMSEFAPEFSRRIKTHGIQVSSLKRLRSGLGYCTRNKRYKLDDREDITISENVTASTIVKQRAYEMPANPTKRAANNGQDSTEGTVRVESTAQKEDEQQPTVKIEEEVEFSVSKLTKSQLVATPGRKIASNEAMASKTKNPSFKVVLKPYNVRRGKSLLHVSVIFIRDYLNISSNATVILTFGGRQWEVLLLYSNGSHCLSRGWATFVDDNQLSEDNICVFELVEVKKITFKVSIVRGGETFNKATGERCSNSFLQNMSAFAPEFSKRIKAHGSHFSSMERLQFGLNYFTRNKRPKLDDGEEITISDNATASREGEKRAYEMPNLARLLLDKSEKKKRDESKNVENLQAGTEAICRSDITQSRIANPTERAAKGQHLTEGKGRVESTTHRKDEQQATVKIEEVEFLFLKKMKGQLVTTPGRKIANNEAMSFKPENPSFTVVLRPYNVRHGLFVNISAAFVRDYLNISSDATVRLNYGRRQWKVLLVHSSGTHRLCRGWSTFVQDNELSEADGCVFELIDVKNIVFKVYIFRAGEGATVNQSSEVKHKSLVCYF